MWFERAIAIKMVLVQSRLSDITECQVMTVKSNGSVNLLNSSRTPWEIAQNVEVTLIAKHHNPLCRQIIVDSNPPTNNVMHSVARGANFRKEYNERVTPAVSQGASLNVEHLACRFSRS